MVKVDHGAKVREDVNCHLNVLLDWFSLRARRCFVSLWYVCMRVSLYFSRLFMRFITLPLSTLHSLHCRIDHNGRPIWCAWILDVLDLLHVEEPYPVCKADAQAMR